MFITKQMLLDKKADSHQVDLFVSLFGEEAEVTKANVLKAYKSGIDFQWAANNLLSPSQLEAYKAIQQLAREAYSDIEQPAWKAYLAIKQPAWEAYLAIRQSAWGTYEAIEQPAWEAYLAIRQSAWGTYEAIEQPAWEDYKEQCAVAFYEACKTN